MMRKSIVTIFVMCLGIFYVLGFTCAEEQKAAPAAAPEEIKVINKIVTLNEKEGATPASLVTEPGTTVIWVNHSRAPIELLFLDRKVTLACGSPVNFFVGKDGAYESGKIPFGGTASLCFTEKGRYDYLIKVSQTFYGSPDIVREQRGFILIK